MIMIDGQPALGVDVGGVIMDFLGLDQDDPRQTGDVVDIPPVTDSIESLATLNSSDKFAARVFLVSRYRGSGPEAVLSWLHHWDFFERTAIPENHFYPCAQRHEKLPIALDLHITHFVDDRAEVLSHMIGVVPHLFLFQNLDESMDDFAAARSHMRFFKTWKELLPALLA